MKTKNVYILTMGLCVIIFLLFVPIFKGGYILPFSVNPIVTWIIGFIAAGVLLYTTVRETSRAYRNKEYVRMSIVLFLNAALILYFIFYPIFI